MASVSVALLTLGTARGAAQSAASLETEVKAAYLLNFTRYVEWPAAAFARPDSPITICVVGRDPFGAVLDSIVENRRVQGREVRVQRAASPQAGLDCQVVYVGGGVERARALAAWRGRPVLLVGDEDSFAADGGTIAFVLVEETVRFEVNVAAARADGLQISSRVLTLATRVYGEEPR